MVNAHSSKHSIDREIINIEQFEDMRDLFEEDFIELIQVYFTDSKQRIASLYSALTNNDNVAGFEAAHALKGGSANLGAIQLINLSDQLQSACSAQKIDQSRLLVEALALALKEVENEINQRLNN
ncbi:Hpt domain-containing protein [Psychrobacter sp. GP33]|uniref:Hpt domain-containing protein n=1 Tax=Psychrobacter sp. GP33 TaxID=2758709 RepID=UPI002873DA65|nr:Hpt domain-containing protein [Psychrobacter sp. GP33]